MPYANREDRLAHNRKYHKDHYVPRPRKLRADKEYVVYGGERRSKESLHRRRQNTLDWHYQNRERRLADQKAHYQNNKEYAKNRWLQKEFGITLEQYVQMSEHQNGVCAICHKPESVKFKGKVKALSVDHNHTTGKVRQLLCHRCNTAIGQVGEDESILLSMVDYLRRHNG